CDIAGTDANCDSTQPTGDGMCTGSTCVNGGPRYGQPRSSDAYCDSTGPSGDGGCGNGQSTWSTTHGQRCCDGLGPGSHCIAYQNESLSQCGTSLCAPCDPSAANGCTNGFCSCGPYVPCTSAFRCKQNTCVPWPSLANGNSCTVGAGCT